MSSDGYHSCVGVGASAVGRLETRKGPLRGSLKGLNQAVVEDRCSSGCMPTDCHSVVGVGNSH